MTRGRARWPGLADDALVPPLDGALRWEEPVRAQASRDAGRYLSRVPRAVLRPGSVADVQAMVRFCRTHRIPVAARGLANTTHGQGLTGGLVIEYRSLAAIHTIGPDHAVADAGATWLELARAAGPHGLTPPALTGYLALTLGGTLSLGGVPPAFEAGSQLDSVHELEVVIGTGELVRCSPTHERDLFEAVLGGLGQFGIITTATVGLVPARRRVRGHALTYTGGTAFFSDLRTLVRRGEISEAYGEWWRPGERGELHHLETFTFYDPHDPPDDAHLLRGLAVSGGDAEITENEFLPHVARIDDAVDELDAAMGWRGFVKPWFTVWLPESQAERFVTETVSGLDPDDVGTGGFVLLYVHRRSRLTRPSLRLPAPDGSDWVYLFTLMTAGPADSGPAYAAAMLRRNRRLYERARALGGVRYPIESVEFGPTDWRDHYGERWPHLERLKRQVDPDGILTPGPGMFA
ncbi:FAD-binding protein [Jiangella asiatica]|uniref:FAD-binding protein n=1 Tax=Jiangella asiatica TaxID=2530372 RepID=UPI00193C8A67|nr:FAD-binding protein [Jiangella asiatica]